MTTLENFQLIVTGGILGILGQGIRILIGLKKLRESVGQSQDAYVNAFDVSRMRLSIFIGFVTGGIAALSMGEVKDQQQSFTLIGIGYLGVDFIEGFFLRRLLPMLQTDFAQGQIAATVVKTESQGDKQVAQVATITANNASAVSSQMMPSAPNLLTQESITNLIEDRLKMLLPTKNDGEQLLIETIDAPVKPVVKTETFFWPLRLTASVGYNGANKPEDVVALKHRFRELGFFWLEIDGLPNQALYDTIKLFQAITRGQGIIQGVDGLVSVPAPSNGVYYWLQAANAPRWDKLGRGSETDRTFGFNNFTISQDEHYYGTNWLIETIEEAGRNYYADYLKDNPEATVIQVNDIAKPHGGEFPPHGGHQTGLMVDIRLPRTDGGFGLDLTQEPQYFNRAATRQILLAFHKTKRIHMPLLNDKILRDEGLCQFYDGHNDHMHVHVKVPSIELITLHTSWT